MSSGTEHKREGGALVTQGGGFVIVLNSEEMCQEKVKRRTGKIELATSKRATNLPEKGTETF